MTGGRWTNRLCAAAAAFTVTLCLPTAGAEAAAAESFSEGALLARPAPGSHAGFQD